MTSSQRSCQYSCSIPDCVLPAAVCTHVLYQGPDQFTQTVQYRPCMTLFKLFWKLWRNRPTDRRTDRPTDIPIPRARLPLLINHYSKWLQGQRSCQYSCSIPDCVLPTAVCTHVLYQGPDQCTQTVQYRPCTTSFKLFWKLCRNRPSDRQTDRPIVRHTYP